MFALQTGQIDLNLLGQHAGQNLFNALPHLTHQRSVERFICLPPGSASVPAIGQAKPMKALVTGFTPRHNLFQGCEAEIEGHRNLKYRTSMELKLHRSG
jgi:hypothetical protein